MEINKVISYQTFKKKEEKKIVVLEKIGKGAFGTVYKGLQEGYGFVALKFQTPLNQSLYDAIRNELKISKILPPDHSILLKRVLINTDLDSEEGLRVSKTSDIEKDSIVLLYDFADGMELQKMIELNKKANIQTSPKDMKNYIHNLLSCLVDLQTIDVVHRDIKPANLILDKGVIKMIDFGFASFSKKCKGKKGTLRFLPPEYFLKKKDEFISYEKGDIFAMGMTILALINNGKTIYENYFKNKPDGYTFFKDHDVNNIQEEFILRIKSFFENSVHTIYEELIINMSTVDFENRWNLQQCLSWFDNNIN